MNQPTSLERAEDLSRLMKLLSDPLRVRIAQELLLRGPASATTLSNHLDASLADCYYHLKVLARAGIAVHLRSRKVRGATERIYECRPVSDWPFERWFPLIVYMIPAANPPREPFVIGLPLALDAQGKAAMTKMIAATRRKAAAVGAATRKRLQGADPVNASIAVLSVGLLQLAENEAAVAEGAGNAP